MNPWKQLLAFSSKGEMDGDLSLPLSFNFCFPFLGDGTDRSRLSMHLLFQEYQQHILFLFAAFLAEISFVAKTYRVSNTACSGSHSQILCWRRNWDLRSKC